MCPLFSFHHKDSLLSQSGARLKEFYCTLTDTDYDIKLHQNAHVQTKIHTWGDQKKNRTFFKKKIFIYISYKKHLIPFKILSIGGNTLVQSFFPPCEASLELLQLDVVECLLRSCFHLLHGGKSLSFQRFFVVGNKKKSQGATAGE